MLIYLVYSSTDVLLDWCEKLNSPIIHKGSHKSVWQDVEQKLEAGEIKEDEIIVAINGHCIPSQDPDEITANVKHLDNVETLLICSNDRYVSFKKDGLMLGRALTHTAYMIKAKTVRTFKRRGITSDNIGLRTKVGFVDNIFHSHKVMCTITKLRAINAVLAAHDDLLHKRE